jgi:uncharacterized DUF497 family protein
MDLLGRLRACTGFHWDHGNADKNWIRHRVSRSEAEEVFLNQPLVVADDDEHSEREERFYALGKTNGGRLLSWFSRFAVGSFASSLPAT